MKKWIIWAVIFYVHALLIFYKGIDSAMSYMDDPSSYVDASRYALMNIDTNYLIAYWVVGAAFVVGGTMFIVTGAIIKTIKENRVIDQSISKVA
ncbi:hypothetical protein [Pseudalkalibacillus hwajinpoensis]|uniref:Uncharacterized protein n=1 Tax=Guptibacillus hwajinpoensis TaxID=208199 RepID=A0A4U1MJ23_9BACL|nr:hypothetical protein [Pseudalkalibacillus hwajinpoensis]TKD70721.1 hypothetical protein FBF83_08870 [Pseudalkalibacillus hwajinpoensis]